MEPVICSIEVKDIHKASDEELHKLLDEFGRDCPLPKCAEEKRSEIIAVLASREHVGVRISHGNSDY